MNKIEHIEYIDWLVGQTVSPIDLWVGFTNCCQLLLLFFSFSAKSSITGARKSKVEQKVTGVVWACDHHHHHCSWQTCQTRKTFPQTYMEYFILKLSNFNKIHLTNNETLFKAFQILYVMNTAVHYWEPCSFRKMVVGLLYHHHAKLFWGRGDLMGD